MLPSPSLMDYYPTQDTPPPPKFVAGLEQYMVNGNLILPMMLCLWTLLGPGIGNKVTRGKVRHIMQPPKVSREYVKKVCLC